MQYKVPISILAVIYNEKYEILLLQRADNPYFWQSVTGSLTHEAENINLAAQREIFEETSIIVKNHDIFNINNWQDDNIYNKASNKIHVTNINNINYYTL